jgi:hypothetical protein
VLFVDTFNGTSRARTHAAPCACCRPPATRAHRHQGGGHCAAAAPTWRPAWSTRRRAKAAKLIDALLPFAQAGIAIVGLEPSCLLTLRDERW